MYGKSSSLGTLPTAVQAHSRSELKSKSFFILVSFRGSLLGGGTSPTDNEIFTWIRAGYGYTSLKLLLLLVAFSPQGC